MFEKLSEIIKPMFGPDWNPDENYFEVFDKYGLTMGRMISGSKSDYYHEHPENLIVFNANVFTKKEGKVWYGDLDVTLDFDKLQDVADKLKQDLYILREMDGRFENETIKFKEVKEVAVSIIKHVK